jgi:hypothetical protein
MRGKIAPESSVSEKEYVIQTFPLARCVPSGCLFHIITPDFDFGTPSPCDFPGIEYLSSTMDSEADAWRSAAKRLRNLERIRGAMEQNKILVKELFPDAFCTRSARGIAQIRRPKRPEDPGVRSCVPLSSSFSEEALAWLDAAAKIQSQQRQIFRAEEAK